MLRAIILLLAVSSGAAAAFLSNDRAATSRSDTMVEAAVPQAHEEILVAAASIARGDSLGPDLVRWQSWPAGMVSDGMLVRSSGARLADLEGKVAARLIEAGEPIRAASVLAAHENILATVLPSGSRAVAIRITAESSAGGFILPNDQVDVIHTTDVPAMDGTREVVSRTILEGVRVLAVDQLANDARAETVLGKTATLELSVEQAERVKAAEATGALSLTLRPIGETTASAPRLAETSRSIRVRRGNIVETVQIN